jgi:hypothetical protein
MPLVPSVSAGRLRVAAYDATAAGQVGPPAREAARSPASGRTTPPRSGRRHAVGRQAAVGPGDGRGRRRRAVQAAGLPGAGERRVDLERRAVGLDEGAGRDAVRRAGRDQRHVAERLPDPLVALRPYGAWSLLTCTPVAPTSRATRGTTCSGGRSGPAAAVGALLELAQAAVEERQAGAPDVPRRTSSSTNSGRTSSASSRAASRAGWSARRRSRRNHRTAVVTAQDARSSPARPRVLRRKRHDGDSRSAPGDAGVTPVEIDSHDQGRRIGGRGHPAPERSALGTTHPCSRRRPHVRTARARPRDARP